MRQNAGKDLQRIVGSAGLSAHWLRQRTMIGLIFQAAELCNAQFAKMVRHPVSQCPQAFWSDGASLL